MDSDLNAARNHEQELPSIPKQLRNLKLNLKGFFWKTNGFWSLSGEEFTVPLSKNIS